MMDLHDAFTRWLISGQKSSLPRDVAVHASACPGCLRATGAFDALVYVDAASAPEPHVEETAHAERRFPLVRGPMLAGGAVLLLVMATTGVMAVSGAFDPPVPDLAAASAATPGGSVIEGVLGNQRSPSAIGTERPTPSADASPDASKEADASASAPSIGAPEAAPTSWVPPLPAASDDPLPAPSSRPSSTPGATAVATATATQPPPPTQTPSPTVAPTPAPTPSLPACSNLEDDDQDGLVDLDDPGCEGASDDDEEDPLPPLP
jgi:hypothetical protein